MMRSIRRNRRGTEKPIEIFVALFVILAVALVMLKLFQSQITEKQKELADVQQEQQFREMKDKVTLHCQSKCTDASNNGCSQQSLAALCMGSSAQVLDEGDFLDLDQNNEMNFNFESLAVGVCEDRVYCFNVIDQCCNRKITPTNCIQLLTNLWTEQGHDAAKVNTLLCSYLDMGSCTVTDSTVAWWNVAGYPSTCS